MPPRPSSATALLLGLALAVAAAEPPAGPGSGAAELVPAAFSVAPGERLALAFAADPGPRRLILEPSGLMAEIRICPAELPCAAYRSPLRYGRWSLLLPEGAGRLEIAADGKAAGGGQLAGRLEPLDPARPETAALLAALGQGTLGSAEATPAKDKVGALRQAAADFGRAGEAAEAAWAIHAAGIRAADLRLARDAQPLFEEALRAWQAVGQPIPAAYARQDLAAAALRQGELDRARELDRQALAEFERLGVADGIATATADLGLIDHQQGHLTAALQAYRRALEVYRHAGDRLSEATMLNNIAGVRSRLVDGGGALVLYRRALALHRELANEAGEIETLNNLAVLYRQMGEPGEALRLYEQLVEKSRAAGNEAALGRALNNQGYTYFSLGDWERAASYFEQALVLRRRQGDRRGEQATLSNLGEVELLRGRPEAARDYHRQALELSRGLSGELGSASLLARDLAALGDPAALPLLEETSRRAAAAGDPALEDLRFREAEARLDLGQAAAARDLFAATLAAAESKGRDQLAALAAAGLGRAERRLHRGEAALAACRRAIGLLEKERGAIDNPGLRATLLAARGQAFETFAATAVEMAGAGGRPELLVEALAVLERGRARGLLDLLAESRAGGGPGAAAGLLADRREVLRRMALLAREQELAQQGKRQGDPAELAAAVEAARVKLERIESDLRRGDPKLAALAPAEPAPPAAWRAAIGDRTRLLYFLLGEEKSLVFVVGRASLEVVELPPRAGLDDLARQAAAGLASPGEAEPALGELAAQLIAPLRRPLAGIEKLWIVADGGLHYLPFAALPWPAEGGRPVAGKPAERLVDRFEIVGLPSGAVLAELLARPGRSSRGEIAVFADPVFTLADARRRAAAAGGAAPASPGALRQPPAGELTPLPGTRLEAERIAALAPRRVHLELGFAASRERLAQEAPRAEVLHLATHGLIDTDHPELSGLALSLFGPSGQWQPEGLLRWDDFAGLPLDAELVVLSGCRTAIGRQAGGEGLLGLSRALFYAGSRRVLASLWPVRDRATAELMERFYRQLLAGRPAAAALRAAQRDLAADPRYADPFHWAAFVLIGDPR